MTRQGCCFRVRSGSAKGCWVLTLACNLDCRYCAVGSRKPAPDGVCAVSSAVTHHVISQCLHMGISKVMLTGGEPLLVPNIVDVVRQLSRSGLAVTLCTNGTLLRTPLVASLRAAGLSKVVVGLDPARAWNPNAASYERRIDETLRGLRRAGLPFEISVVLLPSSDLGHRLVSRFVLTYEPSCVNMIVPQRCGRMCSSPPTAPDGHAADPFRLAGMLAGSLAPTSCVLVDPKCSDDDCPSRKLLYGIDEQGAIGECPWKGFFAEAVRRPLPLACGSRRAGHGELAAPARSAP